MSTTAGRLRKVKLNDIVDPNKNVAYTLYLTIHDVGKSDLI
jgi:hypothetical protein